MMNKTSRKIVNILFLLALAVLFSSFASAQCVTPVDDLNIAVDTVLCEGTYYINDSGSSGVLLIGNNDVNLTCNNTKIVGNTSGYGLNTNGRDRLLISGCNVSNYSNGFYVSGTTDSWFYNITASDSGGLGNGFYCLSTGDRNNITDSRFFRNSGIQGHGLWLRSCDDNNIWNVTAWDNDDGIYIQGSLSADLRDILVFDNGYGVRFNGAGGSQVYNISAWDNNGGVSMFQCSDCIVNLSRLWDNGGGLSFDNSYDVIIEDFIARNNTVSGISAGDLSNGSIIRDGVSYYNNIGISLWDATEGVEVYDCMVWNNTYGFRIGDNVDWFFANGNQIHNNTIFNNTYGLHINYGSQNYIYHNNFTNNELYHAYTYTYVNYFNTTAAGVPQGNYWDGIYNLDIYDSDADDYGDTGPAYPYNSTNGGHVNFYVTDYGPLTDKPPPFVDITISGINGTVLTGSRNVFLNMTYYLSNIARCRWANDAEANLASAPWELCTTVKAWILSAGQGNKSVYMEVQLDDLRSQNKTDDILFYYTQDYIAPTPPTVYDGLTVHDIDWWNSNKSISAHWFNATEDISTIYYRYRLLNNSDYYAGTNAWTAVGTETDITVTGLSLQEGWNMTFEVMAYNAFNFNTTSSSDNVTIDLTKPNAPSINSETHPTQTQAYDSATAIFNFTATDPVSNGVASGIEGYSYLIDKHPGTAPDNNMEERSWETLKEMHKGSYNQTLKVNGSTASDVAYAVFSQIKSNFTIGESIRVRVALAERFNDYADLMGVKVYIAELPNNAVVGDFDYSTMESNAITTISNVSQDIMYVESMTDSYVYEFDLTITGNLNDNTDDAYVVVAGIDTDDDNRQPLDIAGTTTAALVDSTTGSFVCDENDNCIDRTNDLEYAIEVQKQDSGMDHTVQYDYLGDGSYYFHVKAKDFAGNWGDSSHYRIIVAAGGVSSLIYSPVDGELFRASGDLNITVKVSVADNASVRVIALHPLGTNYTSDPFTFNRSYEFENITLKLGQNEIYAVTNTSEGAIAHSPSIFVTVSATAQPYTNKTLRIKYGGGGNIGTHLTWQLVGSSFVGAASESTGSIIGAGEVQTDTQYNTMKIFMTRPFDTTRIDNEFAANDFLDRVNPAFGYRRNADFYIIRNTLAYDDIFLGGNFIVPAGTYQLFIRKSGTTVDGMNNITLTLG